MKRSKTRPPSTVFIFRSESESPILLATEHHPTAGAESQPKKILYTPDKIRKEATHQNAISLHESGLTSLYFDGRKDGTFTEHRKANTVEAHVVISEPLYRTIFTILQDNSITNSCHPAAPTDHHSHSAVLKSVLGCSRSSTLVSSHWPGPRSAQSLPARSSRIQGSGCIITSEMIVAIAM